MNAISRQFTHLGEIYQRFVDIGWRKDAERKRELVAARRALTEQLVALEHLVRDAPDTQIVSDLKREFGRRLSSLRSAIAYHQASWPAVRLQEGEEAEEYVHSSREVTNMFREFLHWGHKCFGAAGRSPDAV